MIRQILEHDEDFQEVETTTDEIQVVEDLKSQYYYEIEMMEQEIGKLERFIDYTESIKGRLDKIAEILEKLKAEGVTEMSAGEYLTRKR